MKLKYIRTKRTKDHIFLGYIVSVPNKKQRYFSLTKYKTVLEAQKNAIEYRNKLLQELYTAPDYKGNLISQKNKSGIIGVTKYKEKWTATFNKKNKSFSTTVYGEEGAFLRAVEERFNEVSKGGFTKIPKYIHL